jgi:signal recognition particle receptor subunit beta
VAVNQFPGSPQYSEEQLREALDLLPETPIVFCDARERKSAAQTLVKLVEYAIEVRNKSEVA